MSVFFVEWEKLAMTIRPLVLLLVFVYAGMQRSSRAETAEPPSTADLNARISELESELVKLQQTFYGGPTTASYCEETPCETGCDTNACDSSSWDCHRSKRGLDGGISLFFAKPHMKESFQATVADVATGTLIMDPFEFDNEISPRVWLGLFGDCGNGIRASYWQYDHDAQDLRQAATLTSFPGVSSVSVIFPAAISTGVPGDVLTVESGIEAQILDVEFAKKARWSGLDLVISSGLRYAKMDQYFNSTVTSLVLPTATLDWTREFEGVGLVLGGDAVQRLGESNFAFTGGARGSLLFGEKEIRRVTVGDVTPAASAVPPVVVLEDADEVSGIFELRLGVQYQRETMLGNLFVHGGYETQLWTAAGAPTLTFLGFEGFAVSVGVTR